MVLPYGSPLRRLPKCTPTWHGACVEVQVGPTDAGGGHPQDYILRVRDERDPHLPQPNVLGACGRQYVASQWRQYIGTSTLQKKHTHGGLGSGPSLAALPARLQHAGLTRSWLAACYAARQRTHKGCDSAFQAKLPFRGNSALAGVA